MTRREWLRRAGFAVAVVGAAAASYWMAPPDPESLPLRFHTGAHGWLFPIHFRRGSVESTAATGLRESRARSASLRAISLLEPKSPPESAMDKARSARGGTLLLMHIPKTAGTSFRSVAERQFPAGTLKCMYPGHEPQIESLVAAAAIREPAAVIGHFRFGLHERLPGGGRYVTFFRDPVDQVISHFNHIQTIEDPDTRRVLRREAGIDEFICQGWARNLQTQFVTGLTPEQIEKDLTGAYRLAKDILSRHFLGIGVVERFAQSMQLLARQMSWTVGKIPRLNRTADRGARILRSDLFESTLNQIAQANACDLRLHGYACQILATERDRFSNVSARRGC